MDEKNKKKQIAKISIFITSIFVIFLSVTYAFINMTLTGTKRQVITTGNLELVLDEDENNLQITDAMPMYDEVGMLQEAFTFRLINKTPMNTDYILKLEDITVGSPLSKDDVKYGLTKNDEVTIDLVSTIEDGTIDQGTIKGNETIEYSLRLWMKDSITEIDTIQNKSLKFKMNVEATQSVTQKEMYTDAVLNGADPVLSDNLVPVIIAADGTVTKADTTKEWYNYDNQEWANAVVLVDKSVTYNEGETIPEDDIESYFVWIPRYRYKIFNDGNYDELSDNLNENAPQTIEIEFENKDTPASTGTTKDSWLTHPAFQAFDTNGLWVGKFESGYKGATTTEEAQVTTADSTKLQIKPNTYSWRVLILGNMFKVSYDYLRSDESHMMKNTEWGSASYLSHSKYGKQDESGKNTEVYSNNNSSFLTGCGGDSSSEEGNATCKNAYGSKINNIYNQSTTGNISGIFDMSGGATEYVMGNNDKTVGNSGITDLYNDFFTSDEWNKYYDLYPSSSNTSYSSRILGDATGEMGPIGTVEGFRVSSWYNDYSVFVYPDRPWFLRGGHYGYTATAGIFNFYSNTGDNNSYGSFRVVLAL